MAEEQRTIDFLSDPPQKEQIAGVEGNRLVSPVPKPRSLTCPCPPERCPCPPGDCECGGPKSRGEVRPTSTGSAVEGDTKPRNFSLGVELGPPKSGVTNESLAGALASPQFPSEAKGAADVIQEAARGATLLGELQNKGEESRKEALAAVEKGQNSSNDVVNFLSAVGREDAPTVSERLDKQMDDSIKASGLSE